MPRRALLYFVLVISAVLALLSAPAHAGGWQEIHQAADDVRIAVSPDGKALVEHHLRFRIVAGRFKSFDVTGIDQAAQIITETLVLPVAGGELPAKIEPNPKVPGALKITLTDAPKGVSRGSYVVDVKYKLDLVATKMLVNDGGMWRLAWTAPPAPEGRDTVRVVYQLPSAPTEPRIAAADGAGTFLPTLRRKPDGDELELVRPHVPRGEAVTWAVRVDPKAFAPLAAAQHEEGKKLAETVGPAALAPEEPRPLPLYAAVLAVVAGLFAAILRTKQSATATACSAIGVVARPLVPIPPSFAPFAYGAAVAAALALFLWAEPLAGAAAVVGAMLLAAHRAPLGVARPRRPGSWRTVASSSVLLPPAEEPTSGDLFDLGTRRGKLAALAVVAAVAGLAFALRLRVAGAVVAIPLTATALVPIFTTGVRAQLPLRPEGLAARVLRPVRDALARIVDLGHVDLSCIARVRDDARVDEVRLACAPSERIPGLRAIELGVATSRDLADRAAIPEVLVRYDDGSEAAAKIAGIAQGAKVVPGRSPDERVLRLAPNAPSSGETARLLARLLADLEERRSAESAAWNGAERRVPRGGGSGAGPRGGSRPAFASA